MTLVSDIIKDAYRESNLIAISATPITAETTEALRLLNRVFYAVFGDEMGEQLESVPIGRNNVSVPAEYPGYTVHPGDADWTVPSNSALQVNISAPLTLYLDPDPRDGARLSVIDHSGNLGTYNLILSGNGRKIEAASSVTLATNSINKEWFYRADLGDWKLISSLSAGDTFPFPEKFDDLFITELAMRLNPRHAVLADPQTVEAHRKSLRKFRARYRQVKEVEADPGIVRLTLRDRYTDADFDSGIPF